MEDKMKEVGGRTVRWTRGMREENEVLLPT
jgi:hypothetical protein